MRLFLICCGLVNILFLKLLATNHSKSESSEEEEVFVPTAMRPGEIEEGRTLQTRFSIENMDDLSGISWKDLSTDGWEKVLKALIKYEYRICKEEVEDPNRRTLIPLLEDFIKKIVKTVPIKKEILGHLLVNTIKKELICRKRQFNVWLEKHYNFVVELKWVLIEKILEDTTWETLAQLGLKYENIRLLFDNQKTALALFLSQFKGTKFTFEEFQRSKPFTFAFVFLPEGDPLRETIITDFLETGEVLDV